MQKERHRTNRVGWLRAAVLGANDGLLSTASLVLGVAAAHGTHGSVLVAGLAGLVAGAMSMAASEYVSVHSQADTERADLDREKAELSADPSGEHEELAAIYRKRSLDAPLAAQVATQLMAKDALGAHARDELGVTDALSARPVQAALTSAASFAMGATVPWLVSIFSPQHILVPAVAAVSLVCLAILGGIAAKVGGAAVLPGAGRVMFWGALAMAVTAGVGTLLERTSKTSTAKRGSVGKLSQRLRVHRRHTRRKVTGRDCLLTLPQSSRRGIGYAMRTDSWVPIVCLFAVLFLPLSGCKKKQAKPAPKPKAILVMRLEPQTVRVYREYVGRTEAFLSVDLRPQATGYITGFFFKEGQMVRKGQLLFQIDPRLYQATVAAARARLARADADVLQVQAQLRRADDHVRRYAPLAAIEAIPQQEYTDALAEQQIRQAELQQMEANRGIAQASLQEAQVNLSYTQIRAPIAGVIGFRRMVARGLASANEVLPLATISQSNPVRVSFSLPDADYLKYLAPGKKAVAAENPQH